MGHQLVMRLLRTTGMNLVKMFFWALWSWMGEESGGKSGLTLSSPLSSPQCTPEQRWGSPLTFTNEPRPQRCLGPQKSLTHHGPGVTSQRVGAGLHGTGYIKQLPSSPLSFACWSLRSKQQADCPLLMRLEYRESKGWDRKPWFSGSSRRAVRFPQHQYLLRHCNF